jgi:hypothetical protein
LEDEKIQNASRSYFVVVVTGDAVPVQTF